MLKSLSIRNVVLIEKLDLEFSAGLCVFSGETGAGKSILLDSLGLLLGSRSETGLIRNDADKLIVSGVFEFADKNNPFFEICRQNELDTEDEIIIKRSISRDGKSKILLNDQPITLRLLKQLGGFLAEIHGQFDNQGLLDSTTHIDVLDAFGGLDSALKNLVISWQAYQNTEKKLRQARQTFFEASRDEETLRHWVDELEKAQVQKGEEFELNRQRQEIMHTAKLLENLNTAYESLQGKNIASFIQKAQSALARVNQLTENRYENIAEMLETGLIQIDEAISAIENSSSEISMNAVEADSIEERLFALKALARKHQVMIDDLPQVLENLRMQLSQIDNNGQQIIELEKAAAALKSDYLQQAKAIRSKRHETAAALNQAVMAELPPLKMERATFAVELKDLPENEWNGKGIDAVCFTVATNPNSPQGALNKIASGGELARFMLALKVNLAQKSSVETLIFDEVDSGIGGATAQAVGERLAKLAKHVQVMVVTHSPQVAAFSQEHFKVNKTTSDNQTTTAVTRLEACDKKEEIARMLSGEKITDEARAAADVLIGCGKV